MIGKNPTDVQVKTEKVVTATNPHGFATLQDIVKAVPSAWKHADVRIGNSIGTPHRVRRIAFYENEDGKRIVMLYEEKLDPK